MTSGTLQDVRDLKRINTDQHAELVELAKALNRNKR
jgi:hypothetical protein